MVTALLRARKRVGSMSNGQDRASRRDANWPRMSGSVTR